MIGDSFVGAMEVPIAQKFHVRLEEMAARELPALTITTSAFGRGSTGQINQLALYDEYVRRLRSKLLVLVFGDNDFMDNSAFLDVFSMRWRLDLRYLPSVYAERGKDGNVQLRPPDPNWASRLPQPHSAKLWRSHVVEWLVKRSYLAGWLDAKTSVLTSSPGGRPRSDHVAGYPEIAAPLRDTSRRWRPTARMGINDEFEKENPPPVFKEALAFTAFALDRFQERTQRDGASLVLLATHRMGQAGGRLTSYMKAMAEARDIPVINQYDYIVGRGNAVEDAHWAHDAQWNRPATNGRRSLAGIPEAESERLRMTRARVESTLRQSRDNLVTMHDRLPPPETLSHPTSGRLEAREPLSRFPSL